RKQVFRLLNRQFSLIRPHFRSGNAVVTVCRMKMVFNRLYFAAELAVQGLATSVICTEAQVFP
ncbi:MAG: hypothetical protein PUA50_01690, partial [Eubacteriales bacterium]|nr:hypothetical protein [Eubacteriales bacterium]